jgi:hypothetical protein
MASAEEHARREAVARVLAGQPTAKVAADLGRSDRWVRKWVARFDPSAAGWAADRSRAPATVANWTPPAELERMVLAVRQRLMDDPWAQVGAAAIAWELTKLGLEPPAVWTIDRILGRAGVAKRRARGRYLPKGTPYPAGGAVVRPGARQEIDLVGPRYLAGATAFHALNAVDVGRRRCGIEILASNQERAVAEGWCACGAGSGCPRWPSSTTVRPCRAAAGSWPCRSGCAWPLGSGCASSPSPSRGATVSSSTSMTCSTSASFAPSSSMGCTTWPSGRRSSKTSTTPTTATRPCTVPPGRVAGPPAVDPAPARPHLYPTHRPAQAGPDRLRPADPLRPAAQDPRGQAPSPRDAGPPLRHRHPPRAPRATRRHLRRPLAHGGPLHPQALTGTMPCCLRCPASERCAATNPRWTTLNDVLLCMS